MDGPVIVITMGDPAGIGPEIIVKAFGEADFSYARPVVVGDEAILAFTMEWLRVPLKLKQVTRPAEGGFTRGILNVLPVTDLSPEEVPLGIPHEKNGRAAYAYIERSAKMVQQGLADAMVTAPISKEALNAAGYPFPGHTQLLASLTGAEDYVMMLAGSSLRVALVTTHIPLGQVSASLSTERIKRTVKITVRGLIEFFDVAKPRIGVAAFNPHAGEGGLFGTEEKEVIIPAVLQCREEGFGIDGPLPADTLFFHAVQGRYDAVVSMYHDQGLIPLKLLHFREGVNITLGLPIIRTSVDHGTGFDIAGKGLADPTSLINAISIAADMAGMKGGRQGQPGNA